MQISPNVLRLDIKVQDAFRQALADVSTGNVKLTGVILGDSDIDYNNTLNINNSRILNAPFNTEGVKYPLVYNGGGRGLNGYITCFARQIDASGNVYSMYNYPTNNNWTLGTTVPTLNNSYDFNSLPFTGAKMGYILYFQTLLYNYVQDTLLERLLEQINVTITFNGSSVVPVNWQVIQDAGFRTVTVNGVNYQVYNNSMLIGKDITTPPTVNNNGVITLTGELSNIMKTINFNV